MAGPLMGVRRVFERLRKAESYDGQVLPPRRLRTGGRHFADNEGYYRGARSAAQQLRGFERLAEARSVLEIGCGAGRLPIGLEIEAVPLDRYRGVDVDRERIDWCRQNLAGKGFEFEHLDLHNERYNPGGQLRTLSDAFPGGQAYDLVYLYSVFSHLVPDDVSGYLELFPRLLSERGTVYVTAFVESGVPPYQENPSGYGELEWVNPLHCCRYERGHFERLVADAGLKVEHFSHGTETDGQSLYLLSQVS